MSNLIEFHLNPPKELNKVLNKHRVSAQSSTYGLKGKMKDDKLVFTPNTFCYSLKNALDKIWHTMPYVNLMHTHEYLGLKKAGTIKNFSTRTSV
jgi:hypothetical protein